MKLLLLLLWTLYLISCAKTGKFACTSTKQCKRHFKSIGDSTWDKRFCRYPSFLAPTGTCKYLPGGIPKLIYKYHDDGDGGNVHQHFKANPHVEKGSRKTKKHPVLKIKYHDDGDGGNPHAKKSNSSNSKKKTVFIKSRRTCYTTKQCQNWRKGSKSPLWK